MQEGGRADQFLLLIHQSSNFFPRRVISIKSLSQLTEKHAGLIILLMHEI